MKLKTLLKYKKKARRKWLKKLGDDLYVYLEEETDRYISQSVNVAIGWINCIENYDISPTDDDMEQFYEYYKCNIKGEL